MIKWIYIVSMWAMSSSDIYKREMLPPLRGNEMYFATTHHIPSRDNGWLYRTSVSFGTDDTTYYKHSHYRVPDSSLIEFRQFDELDNAKDLEWRWKAKFPNLNVRVDSMEVELTKYDWKNGVVAGPEIDPYDPAAIYFHNGKWNQK